jgi:exocyst complex component 4
MDSQGQRPRQVGGASNNYGGYDYGERGGYGERDRWRNDRETERSGGYAGYGGSDYGRQPPPRSQQRELVPSGTEQSYRSRSRSRERDPSSRGAPRQNGVKTYGPGSRKLEGEKLFNRLFIFFLFGARNAEISSGSDILNVIEKDWDFMTLDSCVPVKVALQLMDTSSLGRAHQYDAFRQTNSELQYALQAIVNGGAT